MACSAMGVSITRRGPNALEQSDGGLEHAAGPGHVFTDEHDALVALHLLGDAAGDSVAVRQLRHE